MRIKSFKLLPEAADEDVAWAIDQCVTRQSLTQVKAYEGLKARLAAKGIAPPKFSSFNRLVVEFREGVVPARYRVAPKTAADPVVTLTDLVNTLVDAALKRRGL